MQCDRCMEIFQKESDFLRHLRQRKIPCDLLCLKCGNKMKNRTAYYRHIQEPCKKENNLESKMESKMENKIIVVNGNKNNIITNSQITNSQITNSQITNTQTNVIINMDEINTSRMQRIGIFPVELEQQELLDVHARKMYEMFVNHLNNRAENKHEPQLMRTLFMDMVELLHSNKSCPEYINIIEGERESDYNIVYCGRRYAEDMMPKEIRNKRVMQLMLKQLEQFIKIDNITIAGYIKPFIKTKFIPYIYTLYMDKSAPGEMQVYWRQNKQVMDLVDEKVGGLDQLPTFQTEDLSFEDLDKQILEYAATDKEILGKITEQSVFEVQQIRRKNRQRLLRQQNRGRELLDHLNRENPLDHLNQINPLDPNQLDPNDDL